MFFKKAKEILINYFVENIEQSENPDCTKSNYKNAIKHSFRVYNYALEISQNFDLSENELNNLLLASIFHDIGNVKQREKHALIGSEILETLLHSEGLDQSKFDKDIVLDLVRRHSEKKKPTNNKLLQILKDADLLDQIGAMSILYHSSKINFNDESFYTNLLNVLNDQELRFIAKIRELLNTEFAKNLIDERLEVVKSFIKQLETEIQGEKESLEMMNLHIPLAK